MASPRAILFLFSLSAAVEIVQRANLETLPEESFRYRRTSRITFVAQNPATPHKSLIAGHVALFYWTVPTLRPNLILACASSSISASLSED